MASNQKLYTSDQEIGKAAYDIAIKGASREAPFLVAILTFILNFIVGVFSFIPKVFIRTRMGRRSFGVLTIFFSVLLIMTYERAAMTACIDNAEIRQLNQDIQEINERREALGTTSKEREESKSLAYTRFGLEEEIENIAKKVSVTPDYIFGELLNFGFLDYFSPDKQPIRIIFANYTLFLYAFYSFALIHFLYNILNRNKKIHSYSRGKSLLWGWLVGAKNGNQTIEEYHVNMILDPITLVVISLILHGYGLGYLSFVPIIGAVAIVIEEWIAYNKMRSMVLDMIDAELDYEVLMRKKNQFVTEGTDKAQETIIGRATRP
jgi:hypothetical protein